MARQTNFETRIPHQTIVPLHIILRVKRRQKCFIDQLVCVRVNMKEILDASLVTFSSAVNQCSSSRS
jgi:hypothetical protein